MDAPRITNRIPSGNIRCVSARGGEIELGVELRDTSADWFYWCFGATFPAAGAYRFRFDAANKVGTHGAALSLDRGRTWKWAGAFPHADHRSFEYHAQAPGEAWFCMGLQYLAPQFSAFISRHAGSPHLRAGVLCRSRKGRAVEILEIGSGAKTLLMTARHHAGEMMANHALDGLMDAALADDAFGRAFRREFTLLAVPFVDKDGVEDGDQGKLRAPHDHNRDYARFLYSECAAVAGLVQRRRPWLALDMHCPWIRNGNNERVFMVGTSRDSADGATARFSAALAAASTPDAPYNPADDIPFGESWNVAAEPGELGMKGFAASHDFVEYPLSIEIPFANFGALPVSQPNAAALGANIARAIMALSGAGAIRNK